MRKIFTLGVLISTLSANAQTSKPKEIAENYFSKNEIKINVIYPFWGMGELTYERSLSNHSSVGASLFLDFKNSKDSFYFSPYYRYYFGKESCQGYYLEGQTIFAQSGDNNLFSVESKNNKMLFGIGLGTGYKFVFKKDWLLDANVAYGKFINASKESGSDYFRAGISFGKRF